MSPKKNSEKKFSQTNSPHQKLQKNFEKSGPQKLEKINMLEFFFSPYIKAELLFC